MELYLSHTTALEYWLRGHGRRSSSVMHRKRVSTLPPATPPCLSQEEALALSEAYSLHAPFHVTVADAESRRRNPALVCHAAENLPVSCTFVEISAGLHVACPELALLQSATKLSRISLIKAGFELCGTYQRSFTDAPAEYDVEPTSSVEAILTMANACTGANGIKRLNSVIPYLRDGSASPQETAHALLLGLPFPLGGAGLGVPLMNHRVDLSAEARRVCQRSYLKCDLFWPKWHFDLEYESYEYHASKEKLIEDSSRREALALMGVSVMTVTAAQTKGNQSIETLAKSIAKRMDRELRPQRDYSKTAAELKRILSSKDAIALP